jgi:hypothetical protein
MRFLVSLALSAMCFSLGASCATPRHSVPTLGTARVASDFGAYAIRRVGVLPPQGVAFDSEFGLALRDALGATLALETPYELVPLGPEDLESVGSLDPARRGVASPQPVIVLARRAKLDALIASRVLDWRPYEPVRLGLELDLVSTETGLVIWSCGVRIDTGDAATRHAVSRWQELVRGSGETERSVDLLSPRRMAEFAALQVGLLL